jgi:hypothetical protein
MRMLITSLLLFSLVAAANDARASDPGPANGFRGLNFGEPPTSDMLPTEPLRGMAGYMRRTDDQLVAGVRVAFIVHYFHQGRFCQVFVGWELKGNRAELDRLSESLNRVWGRPDYTNAVGERLWLSRDRATFAGLKRDASDDAAVGISLSIGDSQCIQQVLERDAGL